MQELAELEGLFDDEYVASLRSGELAADELGLFAASRMHNCYIEYFSSCERLVGGLEVLLRRIHRRLDRLLALLPASGAHLTVLVRELESLHQTKNLVHVATNGAVVNGALTQLALTVDDEQTTEGGTSLLAHVDQDVVGRGDLLVEVGKERDVELTQTALLARSVDPRQVRELGVHAAAQHLTAKLAELRRLLAERDDLRGAHEGEVHGVEEEHNVLALVVGQRHSLELSVDDGNEFLVVRVADLTAGRQPQAGDPLRHAYVTSRGIGAMTEYY
ncbi:hypothetical protein GQ600_12908 [Phytophthora cactorum]|nr:hypothetical protein GQ600_12908 [Phytophthora cactorum]